MAKQLKTIRGRGVWGGRGGGGGYPSWMPRDTSHMKVDLTDYLQNQLIMQILICKSKTKQICQFVSQSNYNEELLIEKLEELVRFVV